MSIFCRQQLPSERENTEKMCVTASDFSYSFSAVESGLDLILGHLSEPLFPRKIMTAATVAANKYQVKVDSREQAMAYFKEAEWQDCRISAFGPEQKNPNLLFIDLDKEDFKSERAHRLALAATLRNIKRKLNGAHPTVIDSGRGYHVVQPIKCDIPLEHAKELAALEPETSKAFMQWAERYLSNNKCDKSNYPALKSCLLRIPGSINSKNNAEVKVIQEWDGQRSDIALLIGSFHAHLVEEERQQKGFQSVLSPKKCDTIIIKPHIERLLKTPIDNYRKRAIDFIIIPYLVVDRGGITDDDYDQVYDTAMDWLDRCAELRRLEPSRRSFDYRVRRRISCIARTDPTRRIKAMTCTKLQDKYPELWKKLSDSSGGSD